MDKLNNSSNLDLHGDRIINAGNAQNNFDYITLQDLNDAIAAL